MKHTRACGSTLETNECTHQQHVASQQPGVRILRCWLQQQSTKYQFIAACVHSSVSNVALHCMDVPSSLAAVFHVSIPCSSTVLISGIQTLQQSFTYQYLAAVFHVSKPCSTLSRIQTLQQSFTYPIKPCSSLSHIQTLPAAA